MEAYLIVLCLGLTLFSAVVVLWQLKRLRAAIVTDSPATYNVYHALRFAAFVVVVATIGLGWISLVGSLHEQRVDFTALRIQVHAVFGILPLYVVRSAVCHSGLKKRSERFIQKKFLVVMAAVMFVQVALLSFTAVLHRAVVYTEAKFFIMQLPIPLLATLIVAFITGYVSVLACRRLASA